MARPGTLAIVNLRNNDSRWFDGMGDWENKIISREDGEAKRVSQEGSPWHCFARIFLSQCQSATSFRLFIPGLYPLLSLGKFLRHSQLFDEF